MFHLLLIGPPQHDGTYAGVQECVSSASQGGLQWKIAKGLIKKSKLFCKKMVKWYYGKYHDYL